MADVFVKCGHVRTEENTYVGRDGYGVCRQCRSDASRRYVARNREKRLGVQAAWRAKNPDYKRNERGARWNRENRWRQQGILNPDGSQFRQVDFDAMFAAQQGRCLGCGATSDEVADRYVRMTRLAPDHDHETGFVRGLLCASCNVKDVLAEEGVR